MAVNPFLGLLGPLQMQQQQDPYMQMAANGPSGNVTPLPFANEKPVPRQGLDSDEAKRMQMEFMMRLWQNAPALSPFMGQSFK